MNAPGVDSQHGVLFDESNTTLTVAIMVISNDLSDFLDQLPHPVFVVGGDGDVLWTNALAGAAGLLEPRGGSKAGDGGRLAGKAGELVSTVLDRGEPLTEVQELEGSLVVWRAVPLRVGAASAPIAILTVERRQQSSTNSAEEHGHEATQMAVLGRLVGSVAHDFNNILTGICGNASLALSELEEDAPIRELLSEIENAAERASQLAAQLMAARQRPDEGPQIAELNGVIKSIEGGLRRVLGDGIELEAELDQQGRSVRVSAATIEQILLSLLSRMRESSWKPKKIRLETALPQGEPVGGGLDERVGDEAFALLRVHCLSENQTAVGEGEQGLAPAWAESEGQDLELALIERAMGEHGGSFGVKRADSGEMVVELFFPVFRVERSSYHPPPSLDADDGRGGTVLVVEDESSVRRLAAKILGRLGYHVLAVNSGDRALELASEREGGIDLLLTDVFMPGIKGGELAARLRDVNPEIKVLFMSGFPSGELLKSGIDSSVEPVLRKPFKAAELVDAVQSLLNRS